MHNLMHLRYAAEVERTGSISRAAENLYMNQPNLSKAIRELESELGIPIFIRTAKGATPTEKGREFLAHAKRILEQVDEMDALFSPGREKRPHLEVSVPRTGYAAEAFAEYAGELDGSEGMDLNFRETNPLRAIKNVYAGQDTMAVVRYPLEYEPFYLRAMEVRDLLSEEIWTFSCVALVREDHPLASAGTLASPPPDEFPEILYGDFTVPGLTASESKRRVRTGGGRKTVTVYDRCSAMELLGRLPGAYLWDSPTPKETLRTYSLEQIRCTAPLLQCRDRWVMRSGSRLHREEERFLEKLRRFAQIAAQFS